MDTLRKRRLANGLFLVVVFAAAFGTVLRLVCDDPSLPGRGGLLLFCSALFGFGAMGLAASLRGQASCRFLWMTLPAILLLGLGVATCALRAPHPFGFGARLMTLAGTLLAFFLVLYAGEDREFGKFILKAALGAVLIQCGLGLFQFYAASGASPENAFRGTLASPGDAAGLLAMMFPVAAGLLVNAIHERLDRSVWPRRILYALSVLLLTAGLYHAGSETAWIAVGLGMLCALVWLGRTYLYRNRKAALGTLAVVLFLVAAVTALQSMPRFAHPGYGRLPDALAGAADGARQGLETLSEVPLLGRGNGGPDHAPSVVRFAVSHGLPAAAILLAMIAAVMTLFWKGQRIPQETTLEARVLVGHRRSLKGIEIASVGILGGALALYVFHPFRPALSRPGFLLVFLPCWLLFTTTAFSYKHFRLMVENRRDFVAIGMSAGAATGVFRSFLDTGLLHPPSRFLLFLLLGLALSRTVEGKNDPLLAFRNPKFLRPLAGTFSALLALGAVVLAVAGWPVLSARAAFEAHPTPSRAPAPGTDVRRETDQALVERVRTLRRLARHLPWDGVLWSRLGTARLDLAARRLREGSEQDVDRLAEDAREAFREAARRSRSPDLFLEAGKAWLAAARAASGTRRAAFLERARQAFRRGGERVPGDPAAKAERGTR